jgi:hypothetical protein
MQRCSTCAHAKRNDIDRLLATGTPAAQVAEQFGLNARSVQWHANDHLPQLVTQAVKSEQKDVAFDVMAELTSCYGYARVILAMSLKGDDEKKRPSLALAAIREMRDTAALIAKIGGQLDERPQMNLTVSAEWIEIRLLLMDVLAPFPEARAAAAKALEGADHATA